MASEVLGLREQRTALHAQAKAIEKTSVDEGRDLFDEEVTNINKKMDEATALQTQIDDIEVTAAKSRIESLGDELDTPVPRKTKSDVRVGQDNREKDPKRGWQDFGEFALAARMAGIPESNEFDSRLNIGAAATGMGTVSGVDGGFLLPPAFSDTIWDGLNAGAESLLGLTDRFTVDGESLTFNANAETSRATGSRYGAIRAYWLAEADQMTSSRPKLRQIKLEPHELAVLVYATDKLLKNATAVTQWLTRAAIDEIDFMTGDAIVNGNGVGKPQGILTSNCLVSVSKETGQTAATIVSENIVKMYARLHRARRSSAVWLINQDVEPQLHLMTIGVGTSGLPSYLPPGGLSQVPYATLMGLRVMPVEYCATLGTKGDIILADMKGYAAGTRGGVSSDMSIHLRFDYNESVFRFLFAVDGQPWLSAPLSQFKGSNTTSTFVTLNARS